MAVNQTHPGNPINDPNPNVPKNHSSFDTLAYGFATTERFGDLSPFYVMDHVPDDVTPFRNSCDIRTLSLKSPLMQNLTHHKDFYAVPKEAILPFQWDRIYTNPTNGDDVPSDCNTVISTPLTKLSSLNAQWTNYLATSLSSVPIENKLSAFFSWITIMEMFFSNGSLLNLLGRNLNLRFSNNGVTFDKFYDSFFDSFKTQVKSFSVKLVNLSGSALGTYFKVDLSLTTDSGFSSDNVISLRRFLELYRDNPSYDVTNIVYNTSFSQTTLNTLLQTSQSRTTIYTANDTDDLNYDKCCAYQLVASHFYTNDFVDAVYDAELYRENVKYVLDHYRREIVYTAPSLDFTWNGLKLQYDHLSGHFMDSVFDFDADLDHDSARVVAVYFSLIFSFRKSLRYQDYFTGSKPRPLAVGDVNVNVQSNIVSVIDVTRKIQMQRYLNAVQRVGRKMSNYVKGLFGVDVRPDFHNPLWLASLDDSIGSYEVENTGADQLTNPQTITSIMRSNSSNYAFEVRCDRPMIVLGISWYDIKRHYAYSSDKTTMHVDRFDMFNPMMQFVGDQPVRSNELSSFAIAGTPENFSYQGRYMEYKQKFSRSVGGFVEYLPGFIFQADNVSSRERSKNIDSDYIRSSCVELDPFMLQVSNYSLAGYWHFICLNENIPSGSRPMAYNPNIL